MIMDNLLKSLADETVDEVDLDTSNNNDHDFSEVIGYSSTPHEFNPIMCLDGVQRVYTEDN